MKIKLMHPLVSCICFTDNRPDFLLKSIIAFDQQNYPNTELVISYPTDDDASKKVVKDVIAATDIRIVVVERNGNLSIGGARNEAFAKANGEYLCIWDDDDMYEFSRVADQYNLLHGQGRYFEASVLTRIMLHDCMFKMCYVSDFRFWPSSLLCKKSILLAHPCPDTNQNELEPLMLCLRNHKLLLKIPNNPLLDVNVFHGENTMHYFVYKRLNDKGILIEQEFATKIEKQLAEQISINTEVYE
jgi:glycosyltransferase involved in cell wall biosynthesis